MAGFWLFRWREWPLILRLRRSDWICVDNQLQSPVALPAGWYVISLRCQQADNQVQSILPGQACSLGRGQLRRRVLRLRHRRVVRLTPAAPLLTDQFDRLDLRRVPALRAWGLINRKLRRFQMLEQGRSPRWRRWRLYGRILARSGGTRIRLDQWLRHLARLWRPPSLAIPSSWTEEWTVLTEPNLTPAPEAEALLAVACTSSRSLDLLHTDVLELDAYGRPAKVLLLPLWDPELFRGNPRCIGLWTVRRTVLEGCRTALREAELPVDGAMLRLELLHQLQRERIGHLPQVLATRRRAFDGADLDRWESSARLWFRRRCPELQVTREGDLGLRFDPTPKACFPRPDFIRVSIIIPTRDRCDLLEQCLSSIQSLTQPLDHGKWEIIVVDNGSREPKTLRYLEEIKGQDNITILRDDGPFNYSRLNNRAVEQSQGDVLVFLNNDTEVISSHWLQRLVAQAERPDVGAVGACLLFEDGSVQHGGVLLGIGGVAGHAHKYRNGADDGECLTLRLRREFAAVTGAVLAVERRKFDAVGGLDETHLGVNYNDVDICLRLTLQGWRTLCCPDVRLYHHESRSRGAPVGAAYIQWQQERATMLSRWKPWIEDDPWYNPHFSRREENFGLRLVPALIGLRCWRTPRPSSPVLQP